MFSGIVQSKGKVTDFDGNLLKIEFFQGSGRSWRFSKGPGGYQDLSRPGPTSWRRFVTKKK